MISPVLARAKTARLESTLESTVGKPMAKERAERLEIGLIKAALHFGRSYLRHSGSLALNSSTSIPRTPCRLGRVQPNRTRFGTATQVDRQRNQHWSSPRVHRRIAAVLCRGRGCFQTRLSGERRRHAGLDPDSGGNLRATGQQMLAPKPCAIPSRRMGSLPLCADSLNRFLRTRHEPNPATHGTALAHHACQKPILNCRTGSGAIRCRAG